MISKLANNADEFSLASYFRRRRSLVFWKFVDHLPEPLRILDVGGTSHYWKANALPTKKSTEITILNRDEQRSEEGGRLKHATGDARDMRQFADASFDICFSNSVIEHVGTLRDQISMANEMQRVGKYFFLQTPSKYFPIEPHFLFPFWQFLPLSVCAYLLNRFKIGHMHRENDLLLARAEVEQIRLLTKWEISQLFPGGDIRSEKLCGFTKSYMVYGMSRGDLVEASKASF